MHFEQTFVDGMIAMTCNRVNGENGAKKQEKMTRGE